MESGRIIQLSDAEATVKYVRWGPLGKLPRKKKKAMKKAPRIIINYGIRLDCMYIDEALGIKFEQ